MTASSVVELISEPMLEFHRGFLHPDKKTGMSEYGPYGRTDMALHREQIRVGIVGTRAVVDAAVSWIERCRTPIETDRTASRRAETSDDAMNASDDTSTEEFVEAIVKTLSPDFPGFDSGSPFACRIVLAGV